MTLRWFSKRESKQEPFPYQGTAPYLGPRSNQTNDRSRGFPDIHDPLLDLRHISGKSASNASRSVGAI